MEPRKGRFARAQELELRNAELKTKRNGFTLSVDQAQQLLHRIEKLEKQVKG